MGELIYKSVDLGSQRRYSIKSPLVILGTSVIGVLYLAVQVTQLQLGAGGELKGNEVAWKSRIGSCEFMNSANTRTAICLSERGDSASRLLLLGDSMAGSLAQVLNEVADINNMSFAVAVRGACPFLDPNQKNLTEKTGVDIYGLDETCSQFNIKRSDFVRTWQPDIVVIANRSHRYLVGVSGGITSSVTKAFVQDFGKSVKSLLATSKQVIIVGAIPEYPEGEWVRNAPSILKLLTRARQQFIRSDLPEQQLEARINKDIIAVNDSRVKLLDVQAVFCKGLVCNGAQGLKSFYADDSHLSINGAKILRENFRLMLQMAQ